MKTSDFYFDLPAELIAQYPSKERGNSRLFVYDRLTKKITHSQIRQLSEFVPDHTLVVFNNSKVRKARIYALSENQAKVELVFLRALPNEKGVVEGNRWEVITSKSKRQRVGKKLHLPDGKEATVMGELSNDGTKIIAISEPLCEDWFDQNGHIPLPPYIKREDECSDASRYQTLFSKEIGSAAAPTAGLHFTKPILDSLIDPKRNIDSVEITLHVGLGTFLPVRVENLCNHRMHIEQYYIDPLAADKINHAVIEGKNILAIGTTSVRTLESAAKEKNRSGKLCYQVESGYGETSIFIYPGYSFKIVKKLFTNFHTPESTLLMLVSAFAGREEILNLYQEAIKEQYRFFSYGDAMLLL